MTPETQIFQTLLVGHVDVIRESFNIAGTAGLLLSRQPFDPKSLKPGVVPVEYGIGRDGVALEVLVVAGGSTWDPRSQDEYGLFINTKKGLTPAQYSDADQLVSEFESAFRAKSLTRLRLVKDEHGNLNWTSPS